MPGLSKKNIIEYVLQFLEGKRGAPESQEEFFSANLKQKYRSIEKQNLPDELWNRIYAKIENQKEIKKSSTLETLFSNYLSWIGGISVAATAATWLLFIIFNNYNSVQTNEKMAQIHNESVEQPFAQPLSPSNKKVNEGHHESVTTGNEKNIYNKPDNIIIPSIKEEQRKEKINVAQMKKEKLESHFTQLEALSIVEMQAIVLTAQSRSSVANKTSKYTHLLLKEGSLHAEIDHTNLARETWFHFPGGGLSPLGTKFTLIAKDGRTTINLTDGKIALFKLNSANEIIEITEHDAPYSTSFKGASVINRQELDKLIDQGKIKWTSLDSVYKKYLNKKIVLLMKSGDRLSGKLSAIDGDVHLVIQNDSGELKIPVRDIETVVE